MARQEVDPYTQQRGQNPSDGPLEDLVAVYITIPYRGRPCSLVSPNAQTLRRYCILGQHLGISVRLDAETAPYPLCEAPLPVTSRLLQSTGYFLIVKPTFHATPIVLINMEYLCTFDHLYWPQRGCELLIIAISIKTAPHGPRCFQN